MGDEVQSSPDVQVMVPLYVGLEKRDVTGSDLPHQVLQSHPAGTHLEVPPNLAQMAEESPMRS